VKSRVGRGRGKRAACAGAAAFRSPLPALVATLALLVQLLVIPYHQALSAPMGAPATTDVASVAAGLKATFGDAAALCVQSSDKGGPVAPPAGDCDDHCPLCHFGAQAASLVAPDAPALPERLDAACRSLGAEPEAGAVPLRPTDHNRARAPPFDL